MDNKKVKVAVGDVFRIPITERESGFGQILAAYKRDMLLTVIFAYKAVDDHKPELAEIVALDPLFIASTMDARIWHGHWPLVGRMPPDLERFPLPKYKVGIGGVMCLESFHADQSRPVTDSELAQLPYRNCVAPIRLENALKAFWGIGEWKVIFDELASEIALKSALIQI